MDFQSQAAIAFLVILAVILYLKREKLQTQKIIFPLLYVLMYRTNVGIRLMDSISKKSKRFWEYFGYAGIFVGFAGMIFICGYLLKMTYDLFFVPGTIPGVQVVQPISRSIPGTFFVPFFYWIIAIFVIVIVHEFSHGVIARLYDLKIKSSGLAFLSILIPVVPAAFVEPDEKKLAKRPGKQQLSILAAGSFSNIMLAFLVTIFVILIANPVVSAVVNPSGVLVKDITKADSQILPAERAGIMPGEVILSVNNISTATVTNFTKFMANQSPGDVIFLQTDRNSYALNLTSNPENESLAYMGVFVEQNYSSVFDKFLIWIYLLLLFTYLLNLGVGLFNLLPLPIVDGGRMLYVALQRYFAKEKAERIWKIISSVFLILVIINVLFGLLM